MQLVGLNTGLLADWRREVWRRKPCIEFGREIDWKQRFKSESFYI